MAPPLRRLSRRLSRRRPGERRAPSSAAPGASRCSRWAAAPAVAMASMSEVSESSAAASPPTMARIANTTTPAGRKRIESTPAPVPTSSVTTVTPAMSSGLSFVPKVSIAHLVTRSGELSITMLPIATISEAPSTRRAASSATASPSAIATSPARAPCQVARTTRIGDCSICLAPILFPSPANGDSRPDSASVFPGAQSRAASRERQTARVKTPRTLHRAFASAIRPLGSPVTNPYL